MQLSVITFYNANFSVITFYNANFSVITVYNANFSIITFYNAKFSVINTLMSDTMGRNSYRLHLGEVLIERALQLTSIAQLFTSIANTTSPSTFFHCPTLGLSETAILKPRSSLTVQPDSKIF